MLTESLLIKYIYNLIFFLVCVDNSLVMGLRLFHGFQTKNSLPPERGKSLKAIGKEHKLKQGGRTLSENRKI